MPALGAAGAVHRIWAGFARSEILHWWIQRGGELLDIPATEFAERSDATGELVWDTIPAGLVIRALLDRQTEHELVKIVTREATPDELVKFQHNRMPLLEKPLHPATATLSLETEMPTARAKKPRPPKPKSPPGMVQDMLFDF